MLYEESKIVFEVLSEYEFQHQKWGKQDHDPATWLMILGEEVGEANKAVLESMTDLVKLRDYRQELIHVAAVALSAIECYDNKVANFIKNLDHFLDDTEICGG